MPNPWMILGMLAVCAGVWFHGNRSGQAKCEARHNLEQIERIADGERLKEQRRQLETQVDALTRELEIERNEDPITVTQCLGPSRVRRLNAISK